VQPAFFTEFVSWSVETRRQRGSAERKAAAAAAA
jgi:hypothetical protein